MNKALKMKYYIDIYRKCIKKHAILLRYFVVFFFSTLMYGQHYESVAITGVISGAGSQNVLFSVSCPTVPSLTRMRVQKVSGAGTVVINQSATNTDNFTYLHNSGFTAGIPNNVSRMSISFLQTDGVTPIPANDFRLVIDDIDGPNNEGIYTDCGSSVRFTSLAIPTDLTLNTTPPNLGAVGTANETSGAPSRIMFEYNDVSTIFYTIYANNGFVKEFDLNYNNFPVNTPKFAVCVSDSDGDGIADNLDMDDDNDGILDSVECGGNDPNGDADGDGLPNYLDTLDNRIAANNFGGVIPANYIASRDSSITNYTDADGDGVPDVYDSSADSDSLPNHLDLDSDGDGCYDAVEGDENVTPAQLLGTGTINIASNGGVGTTVNVNNGVPNLVNSGGAADIGADVGQGAGNSLNANIKDALCYTLSLFQDFVSGTIGVAFNIPNVLTNDTLDGVTPVIGSNPGQVAISQSGVWPAGISLNTTTGQVNVGSSVPAGTYNVTYQVCVNGTSPALCNTNTITIVVTPDADGDLISDDIDLDDDNDGILDTVECPDIFYWSNVPVAAGNTATGTINGINYTYSSSQPVTTSPIVNYTSLPISYGVPNQTAIKNTLVTNNTLTFATPMKNPILVFTSIGQPTISVPIHFSSPIEILWSQNVIQDNLQQITGNEGNAIIKLNGTFSSISFDYLVAENYVNFTFGASLSGFCDLDGDGISNQFDLDSDGDGCPDAIEGGAIINNSSLVNSSLPGGNSGGSYTGNSTTPVTQNLGNTVGNTATVMGIPIIAGVGQGLGDSQNKLINACTDSDNDGLPDSEDLDDDNDGILDHIESPNCFYTAAELLAAQKITSSLTSPDDDQADGDIQILHDGANTLTFNYNAGQNITGATLLRVEYPTAVNISQLSIVNNTTWGAAVTARLEGSYDGVYWADLGNGNVALSNATSPKVFNNTNTNFYKFYRIFGTAGTTTVATTTIGEVNTIFPASFSPSRYPKATCSDDFDSDGIPNYLDTDSDNDGCPDAIEGAGKFNLLQLSPENNLGNVVDANGVPTIASGGQATTADVLNASNHYACNDFDNDGYGDGYPDELDLDDDNDGILDTVEMNCEQFSNGTFSTPNTPLNTPIPGWTSSTGNSGVYSNSYYFGGSNTAATGVLYNDLHIPGGYAYTLNYKVGVAGGGAGTVSLIVEVIDVATNTIITSKAHSKVTGNPTTSETISFISLGSNTRVRFRDTSPNTNSIDIFIDDVSLKSCDTDGDGIPNSYDLDSDNDGCPDALEAAANINLNQLNADYSLSGGVDSNGVPLIVSGGQATTPAVTNSSDSSSCLDSDGDGYPDMIDLDDDNDGILDTDENIEICNSIKTLDSQIPNAPAASSTPPYAGYYSVGFFRAIAPATYGPWSVISGNADFTKTTTTAGWISQDGGVMLDGGNNDATLSTAATTIAGRKYKFKFYIAKHAGAPLQNQSAIVTALNGATVLSTNTYTATVLATQTNWTAQELYFTATSTATTIKMEVKNVNNNGYGAVVSGMCLADVTFDYDNDGIPNNLDLDSDGDGCSDAIEGGNSFTNADLVTSSMPGGNSGGGYTGTSSTPITQNLGNIVGNTASTNGVPTIAGTGQSIGTSQNSSVVSCSFACYKPAQMLGTVLSTDHGFTALGRAENNDGDGNVANDWPMARKGAWTVLEAKTKGFVVNRLTDAQITAIPAADLREGMMVYNITQDCLQINVDGTATGWKCFNTQACPD